MLPTKKELAGLNGDGRTGGGCAFLKIYEGRAPRGCDEALRTDSEKEEPIAIQADYYGCSAREWHQSPDTFLCATILRNPFRPHSTTPIASHGRIRIMQVNRRWMT